MKHSNIFKYVAGVAVLGFMTSCNDFLDQEPMSSVSPEKYLKDESQLEAYANKLYTDILPGQQYTGANTVILASSVPNHNTPPIASGRLARICATKVKAVC